jgi:hypothetical protein
VERRSLDMGQQIELRVGRAQGSSSLWLLFQLKLFVLSLFFPPLFFFRSFFALDVKLKKLTRERGERTAVSERKRKD